MHFLRVGIGFLLLAGAIGCEHVTTVRDFTPPDRPRNVTTEAGDGRIEITWSRNTESDVAGYNVFVSSTYDGRYDLIGSTGDNVFVDRAVRNGSTYYYAVTAYDFDGNESELSIEEASDIPRPEGYGQTLNNYRMEPAGSGYDFSAYAALPYTDAGVDMYYEQSGGRFLMRVPEDTDIQDMGATGSILDIRVAPSAGWSTTGTVDLHSGHTYVVWTWDDHYAKFRVRSLSPSRVVFDWAYQLQRSNPLMKRAATGDGERRAVLRHVEAVSR